MPWIMRSRILLNRLFENFPSSTSSLNIVNSSYREPISRRSSYNPIMLRSASYKAKIVTGSMILPYGKARQGSLYHTSKYSTDRYCLPYRETKGYYFKP